MITKEEDRSIAYRPRRLTAMTTKEGEEGEEDDESTKTMEKPRIV